MERDEGLIDIRDVEHAGRRWAALGADMGKAMPRLVDIAKSDAASTAIQRAVDSFPDRTLISTMPKRGGGNGRAGAGKAGTRAVELVFAVMEK